MISRHLNHLKHRRGHRLKFHQPNPNHLTISPETSLFHRGRRYLQVEAAVKMSARPLPSVDETIYVVREWKTTLDPSAKWWQKLFHRFLYCPFNEFALKVVKIPPATSATIDGSKVTLSWVEDSGFFADEDQADFACLTPRYSYQAMTFGRLFPSESAQCVGPTIFPRAKQPRKRAKPILTMIIKPRAEDDRERRTLAETLNHLNRLLDRRVPDR